MEPIANATKTENFLKSLKSGEGVNERVVLGLKQWLILLLLLVFFAPSQMVSDFAYGLGGPSMTLCSLWLVHMCGRNYYPISYTPYAFAFLSITCLHYLATQQFGFQTNHNIQVLVKLTELIGMGIFGLISYSLIKRFTEYGIIVADITSITFALSVAAFLFFWPQIESYVHNQSIENILTAIVLLLTTFIIINFTALSILTTRFKATALAAVAIGVPVWAHYVISILTQITYAPYDIPNILGRLDRVLFDLSGILLLVFATTTPSDFYEATPPTEFEDEEGHVLLTFLSAICLLTIPSFAIYSYSGIFGNEQSIPLPVVIVVQTVVTVLILYRFGAQFTSLLRKKEALRNAAMHDQLTGALNRRGLIRRYNELQEERLTNERYSLAFIDINEFTAINNSYGHRIGDLVLQQLCRSIGKLNHVAAVSRLGGDEFAIIFRYFGEPPYSSNDLRAELNQWVILNKFSVYLSVSAGITDVSDESLDTALDAADIAMYGAKKHHMNDEQKVQSTSLRPLRQHIKELLQHAIETKTAEVYVQPIYSLKSYQLTAVEVLSRLDDGKGSIIMPDVYIPVARDNRQLENFDTVVIHCLLNYVDQLNCDIHINTSPEIIENLHSARNFGNRLKSMGIPIEKMVFEITEKQQIDHDSLVQSTLMLHKMGFRFALDDFGTGYSSLERVTTLPFESIKLDGALLRSARRGNSAAIHAAISLTRHLGAKATVECVESAADIKLIRRLGGDQVQGFYLCPPIPIKEFVMRKHELQFVNSRNDFSPTIHEALT